MLKLRLSLGYVTSFLPACAGSNFSRFGEERLWPISKPMEVCGRLKEFSIEISALRPLQQHFLICGSRQERGCEV